MSGRTVSTRAAVSLGLAALSLVLWPFSDVLALAAGGVCLILAVLGLWDISRSEGRLRGYGLAVVALFTQGVVGVFVFLVAPSVRESAQRMTSHSHLKQLACAMHNYSSGHGSLPPPAIYEK